MKNNINPNSATIFEAKEILGEEIVAITEQNTESTSTADGTISLFGLAALLTRDVLEQMEKLKEMEKEKKRKGDLDAK